MHASQERTTAAAPPDHGDPAPRNSDASRLLLFAACSYVETVLHIWSTKRQHQAVHRGTEIQRRLGFSSGSLCLCGFSDYGSGAAVTIVGLSCFGASTFGLRFIAA